MEITRIHCVPVRVPRRGGVFKSSLGVSTFSENAVVEVETDSGVNGVGEISSVFDECGTGEAKILREAIAPRLIGRDPFCITECVGVMEDAVQGAQPAKAAIEMALFDIVGRTLDTPVYNLLGGLVRDRVRLSYSLSMGEPNEIADRAEALVREGYTTLKAKIGQDIDADEATLSAIRQRVGSAVTIRVDVNMGWKSIDEAVEKINRLTRFDLELIEQPLPRDDLAGLATVRERVDVPIMADESVWTPADAIACVRLGSVDLINVYVTEAGGLSRAASILSIAAAAGVPCLIGSMPELGIGTTAQAHLAFAAPNLPFANDVNGCVYHSDDVIKERLDIDGGFLSPPPGPGLGVTVDWDKVERYRV